MIQGLLWMFEVHYICKFVTVTDVGYCAKYSEQEGGSSVQIPSGSIEASNCLFS